MCAHVPSELFFSFSSINYFFFSFHNFYIPPPHFFLVSWGCTAPITWGFHGACCAVPVHSLPDHRRLVPLPQMLRVPTRRRVGVRRRAVTARVTWLACTPTTGACLAVHTRTGCLLKVSPSVWGTERLNSLPPSPPSVAVSPVGMFSCARCCALLIVRAVDLLIVSWTSLIFRRCVNVFREVTAALLVWPSACADGFAWWLPA